MSDTVINRVVCAAMRNSDGVVICSVRHWDRLAHAQVEASTLNWRCAEQGFVDNFGKFLTRKEALVVAVAANQIVRRCGSDDDELFSENLY